MGTHTEAEQSKTDVTSSYHAEVKKCKTDVEKLRLLTSYFNIFKCENNDIQMFLWELADRIESYGEGNLPRALSDN